MNFDNENINQQQQGVRWLKTSMLCDKPAVSCLLCSLLLCGSVQGGESSIQVLTAEDLANYQFIGHEDPPPPVIREMNLGDRTILRDKRREVADLLARRVGVLRLTGTRADIPALQQFYDRRIVPHRDVLTWQAIGVAFGDILANELDLEWIIYEDHRGTSKALRWRKTDNFLFPVTMFSKRLRYGEALDIEAIYDEMTTRVGNFKRPLEHLRQ